MTEEAAVVTPAPELRPAGFVVPVESGSWDRIERWILLGLFAFGLVLPIAGAVLAAVLL